MNTKSYIRLAMGSPIQITSVEGNEYENQQKDEWLKAGRRILRQLAKELGLPKGSFNIRINAGGVAVSGDAILHGSWIYVNLSQSCLGNDFGFMWRICKCQKDYTGGSNQWSKWETLLDLPKLSGIMKEEHNRTILPLEKGERTFTMWR